MLRKILLAVFLTVSVAFSATLDDAKSYSVAAHLSIIKKVITLRL